MGPDTQGMPQTEATKEVPRMPRDPPREERLLRLARNAQQGGRLDEAERKYLELLALDSGHAEALHLLGTLRWQQRRLIEAEGLIRLSIERHPTALALSNHAAVLTGLGQVGTALVQIDEALRLNPSHPRALFQRGGMLAHLGRGDEAVAAYDRLLEIMPASIETLCNRSAVLRALGRFDEALASCERALAVDGRSIGALKEQGQVMRRLERHEEALISYGTALTVAPADVEILFVRGVTFLELGRLPLALESFNAAIASSPGFTDAIYNSAVVLERLGHLDDAVGRCDRVLAIDPRHANAFSNRGNALQRLGRNAEALASYTRALELKPDVIEVLCNQASALRHLNRLDEALESCDRALGVNGKDLSAWFARGRALQALHRYDEALACFEYVIEAKPRDRIAHFHRGNVLTPLRRHTEASDAYAKAIEIDPDYVLAHCMRSFLCLSIADFEAGWAEYEWRWRDEQMVGGLRSFAQVRWTGAEPLAGRTILLYAEQGLGDTLQFCRYVPIVKALGATVVLEAQPELKSLLATLPGVDEFVDRSTGAPLPPFDLYCPLLSVPLAVHTDLSSIPCDVPYLQADPALVAKWQTRLGEQTRPRIGLVWSGNPKHLNDRNRSIPLTSLLPLMTDRFEWISLQKVVRDEDQDTLAGSAVRHFGEQIVDFADTAALLATVDCVLSVDTSVAHLAGALGKPLWLMLPHTPDFRWLLDREDSPWYPQARLFRQSQAGDWTDVFEQIAAALPSVALQGNAGASA
ncbi:tetratricopeptide repeat protein [Paraburkholderia sp. BCC1885]|uniref:tetratricopeptide repeat protein n=1 Tax=Paraburkholderia sp. BCC1885 TaxID=2562669 RepID=UPI0011828A01|nr:tetratricopeptide repeat protein [Paraburkholderia sp. BCC1885]